MHDSTDTVTDTATIQGHTRPRRLTDLPDYQRQGHHIATLDKGPHWLNYPDLGEALIAVVRAARTAGLTVTDDGRIEAPLSQKEITQAVEHAQQIWDINRDAYLAALNGTVPVADSSYRRDRINQWAVAEGVRKIDWSTFPEVTS